MKRPTITVNGKTYELPKPKCGVWRKLMEADKNTREVFSEDFIENRCAFLAEAFGGGLTADFLLDNMYLEDAMQAYREVTKFMIDELTPKLEEAEKNGNAGDTTIQ
ncbi:MAG: hypothetical protein IKE46_00370 [Selenomonadaceae bacterium]|nr:hypothetical protein [Selenomonadaceae bacterium]MBR3747224.1 hypothetical protein [Selenomonadaceae bacterium]